MHIQINETGFDTDAVPQLTYAGVAFTDLAGNPLNGGAAYANGDITEVDESPPAFASITTADTDADGQIDQLDITFSEPVDIYDYGEDSNPDDGLDCLTVTITDYTIAEIIFYLYRFNYSNEIYHLPMNKTTGLVHIWWIATPMPDSYLKFDIEKNIWRMY